MSDWKNPSWGSRANGEWKPPMTQDDNVENIAMTISLVFRAIIGFLLVSTINALAFMAVAHLLNFSLSYRNALAVGAIYVCWRAYDTVMFTKFRNTK